MGPVGNTITLFGTSGKKSWTGVSDEAKPKKGAEWVRRLGTRGKLKDRIAAELVRKKVLKTEQGKILWIFDTTRYPERDGRPEKEVVARLKRAIFTATGDVAPRTVVLVALAAGVKLLGEYLGLLGG